MPKITGADKVTKKLEALSGQEKIKLVGQALFAAGQDIQAEAQISITLGSISGKFHVPSLPGEPPNNDTGFLKDNITVTQPAPLRVRIASNAPYSAFLEFGTSRMAARPFMGPAARARKDDVVAMVRRAVDIATRK